MSGDPVAQWMASVFGADWQAQKREPTLREWITMGRGLEALAKRPALASRGASALAEAASVSADEAESALAFAGVMGCVDRRRWTVRVRADCLRAIAGVFRDVMREHGIGGAS